MKGSRASCGAAELDFGEFLEIVARICNEKVPEASRHVDFEQTLDVWLGLAFLPALRNAGRNLLATKIATTGGRRRSNGISVQSSSQANSRRPSVV